MNIYSCIPNNEMIDFWIKNNLNVLFHGKHGVGKTSLIIDGFIRNHLKFLQFSAATMDPWVDFIGVPKEKIDEKGSYLDIIRPKSFRDDEIEAIFFDEFNRSHKKVRNAVMELIQFKSINGKKFPNLKIIWAAINPSDAESAKYDVEILDPAQFDRFQVHIELPYKPHVPYFREKFGIEIADAAIDWWKDLPPSIQDIVSPRRLEMALNIHKINGALHHVLPPSSNPNKLCLAIEHKSPIKEYKKLINKNNENEIKEWLKNENNFLAVKDLILKNPSCSLHLIEEERISSLMSINKKIADHVFNNAQAFESIIKTLACSSTNKTLKDRALKIINSPSTKLNITYKTKKSVLKIAKHYIFQTTWNNSAPEIVPKTNSYSGELKDWASIEGAIKLSTNAVHTITTSTGYVSRRQKITFAEKIRICNSAITLFSMDIKDTLEFAQKTLRTIDWVASNCQSKSLKNKAQNIIPAINKAVRIIRKNDPLYSCQKFAREYPNIVAKIFARAEINEIGKGCLI
jgi:hypothetical protein